MTKNNRTILAVVSAALCILSSSCQDERTSYASGERFPTDLPLGAECYFDDQCVSMHCVDQICSATGAQCNPACDSNESCISGVCKLKNGEICQNNSNCVSNHCENNVCKGEIGDECAKGDIACLSNYCQNKICQEPSLACNPACSDTQTCINGACKNLNGLDCETNSNCADNQCISGKCLGSVTQECSLEANDPSISACVSSAHCKTDSKTCVECLNNDQCSDGKVCNKDNVCASACQTNEDCGDFQECSDGACTEASCASNSDCPDDKLCNLEKHKCLLKNGEKCLSDQLCNSQICLDDVSGIRICKGNVGDECENGEIACILSCDVKSPASESVCYNPNTCTPDCADGQVCVNGSCKSKNGQECKNSDDCLNGNCSTIDDASVCLGNITQECELEKLGSVQTACLENLVCNTADEQPACVECTSDDNCNNNQKCVDNTCILACEKDEDCNSKFLICNTDKNICEDAPCDDDSQCDDGKRCDVEHHQCKVKNGWDCTKNDACYSNICSTEDFKCKGETGDECEKGNIACLSALCGDDKTCKIENGKDCKDFTSNDCFSAYCSNLTDVCEDKPECLPTEDTCTAPDRCAETQDKSYKCTSKGAIIVDDAPETNEVVTIPVKQPDGTIINVTGYKTSEADTKSPAPQTESICIHLSMAPEKDVTVGCEISLPEEAQCKPVTFTPDNYATTQCIEVWGLDDPTIDGDQAYSIELKTETEADSFKDVKSDDPFYFVNADDDTGSINVTETGTDTKAETIDIIVTNRNCNEKSTNTDEANNCKERQIKAEDTESFDVTLSAQPVCGETVTVVVSIDPNQKDIQLGSADKKTAGTEISLAFDCENWNKPQTVVVAGTDKTQLTDPDSPIEIKITTKPEEGGVYPESSESILVSVHELRFSFNYINATECEVSEVLLEPGTYKLQVWGASGGDASTINKRNNDESDADCKPVSLSHTCSHYDGGGDKTVDCATGKCYLDFNNKPVLYSRGGLGGYSTGTLTLKEQTTVFVSVGVEGQRVNINERNHTRCGLGGRGLTAVSNDVNWFGYNGGGATDIRINENDTYHRVIVAGGGGGPDNSGQSKEKADGTLYTDSTEVDGTNDGSGGFGGGAVGGDSTACVSSVCSTANGLKGATQTTGYLAGNFGEGMSVSAEGGTRDEYGGGGGGWYGGLSRVKVETTNTNTGGSGGSGFVFTADSDEAVASVEKNFGKPYALDPKYQLTDAKTFAGNQEFPAASNDGKTEKGHKLDGYAIITRIK